MKKIRANFSEKLDRVVRGIGSHLHRPGRFLKADSVRVRTSRTHTALAGRVASLLLRSFDVSNEILFLKLFNNELRDRTDRGRGRPRIDDVARSSPGKLAIAGRCGVQRGFDLRFGVGGHVAGRINDGRDRGVVAVEIHEFGRKLDGVAGNVRVRLFIFGEMRDEDRVEVLLLDDFAELGLRDWRRVWAGEVNVTLDGGEAGVRERRGHGVFEIGSAGGLAVDGEHENIFEGAAVVRRVAPRERELRAGGSGERAYRYERYGGDGRERATSPRR
jgi:hypothetical protein